MKLDIYSIEGGLYKLIFEVSDMRTEDRTIEEYIISETDTLIMENFEEICKHIYPQRSDDDFYMLRKLEYLGGLPLSINRIRGNSGRRTESG